MPGEIIQGPWRATRLWNEIVRTFNDGMPHKKHRTGHLRTGSVVENCFSGSEAVDWLHKNLRKNPNFGSNVTKEQTTMLLHKFVLARLIVLAEKGRENEEKEFDSGELYRLPEGILERLKTPGKKSPTRSVLSNVGNTPVRRPGQVKRKERRKIEDEDSSAWETKSEMGGVVGNKYTPQVKAEMNRSYFQSLPPNSLIILDNDNTWKAAFLRQLSSQLSEVHVKGLDVNVSYVIYNMTKVSAKGVVQLACEKSDLPHWVLSAMKCLANWPRPMRTVSGLESSMPNYPGFINDVFNVVKEYFSELGSPLIPVELFDLYVSAHIKAEAVGTRVWNRQQFLCTSTPSFNNSEDFYSMTDSEAAAPLAPHYKRVAHIRSTQNVNPSLSSFEASTVNSGCTTEELNANMSTTAIMRNFLPPNTCFETAFMHENPVTRIVPQKESETLHLLNRSQRHSFRRMAIIPQANWDTRSIATQTSQDDNASERGGREKRQPRWKRSSSQRKSIAVMEFPEGKRTYVNRAFETSPSSSNASTISPVQAKPRKRFSSSVDDLLESGRSEERAFFERYKKTPLPAASDGHQPRLVSDNIILSKAVRKEKKKQQMRMSRRANSVDRISTRRASSCSARGYDNRGMETSLLHPLRNSQPQMFTTSHYQDLTVKTPLNPFPPRDFPGDLQSVRAEPYQPDAMSPAGVKCAIESFKLLGLLLPPANRRKLQLLLKFMRRVSSNQKLRLGEDNLTLALDVFTPAVLRPSGISRYDDEMCRKITKFFVHHYDDVWTPSEPLRREVEEKVYQSLVSQRIEAGEDPYPITYCQRVSSKAYEHEKTLGVHNAMLTLLEQIVSSDKMSEKEKRKKLTKFKEAYPDIYRDRFPSDDKEPSVMKVKKMTSLSKLKSVIRL